MTQLKHQKLATISKSLSDAENENIWSKLKNLEIFENRAQYLEVSPQNFEKKKCKELFSFFLFFQKRIVFFSIFVFLFFFSCWICPESFLLFGCCFFLSFFFLDPVFCCRFWILVAQASLPAPSLSDSPPPTLGLEVLGGEEGGSWGHLGQDLGGKETPA